ncbi:hypothetical protein ANN_26698 [Periplaneta americana]|uniref:DNA-directed DNA polymerase n=1 Tax=Periplaneta americana TaxID=6978 RepID=A0ABQ8RYT1_PERAM|nr:hypothetical protein ANN_26698 [Periplaneta americana]
MRVHISKLVAWHSAAGHLNIRVFNERAKNFEHFDVVHIQNLRYRVRFLDTYNYLSAPLAKLTSTVTCFRYAPADRTELDDYFVCETTHSRVHLNKPVQIGCSILELAKLEVYHFYYALRTIFGENMQLLYHDTDSLVLFFERSPIHPLRVMAEDPAILPLLDFEKAPENYVIRTYDTHKEVNYRRIVEFVGLRAKTYAIRFEGGYSHIKNKGVIAAALVEDTERHISFEDYKKCLFEN